MSIYIRNIVRFILAIAIQVLIINRVDLGPASYWLYPLFYGIFIILLPLSVSPIYLIVLAFLQGLCIDAFMSTGGLHASSLVFMAFLRPRILKLVSPREDYDPTKPISVMHFGLQKFFVYAFLLSLLHHTWFFTLEFFKFSDLHLIIFKSISGAFISTLLILLADFLTFRRK